MTTKLTLNVVDQSGKTVDTLPINEKLWAEDINEDLLHQVVVMSLANKRAGTASTKDRSEVRGGGKKPWRQKGTGRARAGSIRSPLWRGGGVVFGPHPKDYSYSVPQKIKRKALIQALASKIKEKNLILISDFKIERPKTKEVMAVLKKLKVVNEKNLLVVKSLDETMKMAGRNLAALRMMNVKDLNAYEVLNSSRVILTKEAFLQIEREPKL